MKRDEYGVLVSEECGWPGNIGDSCANTARAQYLRPQGLVLSAFITELGVIRHPTAPTDWREIDTSDDQLLPLYCAGDNSIKEHIKEHYPTRAGNGNLHTPLTYGVIWGHQYLINVTLLIQLFFMVYVSYRWSDANGLKWYQRFERTEGSSADWLNWFITCVYMRRKGKLWFKPPIDRVAKKVYDYYRDEPNNGSVLLDYEEGFKLWE